MDEFSQFEALLQQLLSGDNEPRNQAEKAFKELKKDPMKATTLLLRSARTSSDIKLRNLSFVLMRRCFNKEKFWKGIDSQTQLLVKTELLNALESESSCRNSVCDCIAELAQEIFLDEQPNSPKWPELLPCMFKLTKSPHDVHRENALSIFGQLARFLEQTLKPYHGVLKEIFISALSDSSIQVRIEALRAVSSFLETQPDLINSFQDVAPHMLEMLRQLLSNNDEDNAKNALEILVGLAENASSFFRTNIQLFFQAMMSISTSDIVESGTKHLALEFLVSLAESRPALVRKLPNLFSSLLPVLLKMLMDLEEDPKWNDQEDSDDEDEESDVGAEYIDRISIALGGKQLIPALFQMLGPMLQNQDWRCRHAALSAIALVGEGSERYVHPLLPDIVKTILNMFTDQHPRVRWAACNTIGQMLTDFGPELQTKYHQQILPAIVHLMADPIQKVQAHAASALINFCDKSEADQLEPYLDGLLGALLRLFQEGRSKLVQEQTLTAVAAIAECVEEKFNKYYESFAPYMKMIITQATSKDHRQLRGKAIEAITILGEAVGRERFMQDAKEVMSMIMTWEKLDDDDPQVNNMLNAYSRVCAVLEKEFIPYLDAIMPGIIRLAKQEVDVKLGDENSQAEGWDFIKIGDKKTIGIRTSALEEKNLALEIILSLSDTLEDGFINYVDVCLETALPMVHFYYHEGIRNTAILLIPSLMGAKSTFLEKNSMGKESIQLFWKSAFPEFLSALGREEDTTLIPSLLLSFQQCIELGGKNTLSTEEVRALLEHAKTIVSDCFLRRASAQSNQDDALDAEEDKEIIEDAKDQEDDILSNVIDFCCSIIKTHPEFYMQHLSILSPLFTELISPTSSAHDRMVGICIYDDIMEHGGPLALGLLTHCLSLMQQNVFDKDPHVRQAAAYGIGICGQVGGEQFQPYLTDSLKLLHQVITSPPISEKTHRQDITPEELEEEAENSSRNEKHCRENAVSAFGRILKYHFSQLGSNAASLLALWVSFLPVTEDKVESQIVYDTLLTFLESQHTFTTILGEELKNLPGLLNTLATAVGLELDDELNKRIGNVLKNMQSCLPGPSLQQAFSSLDDGKRELLGKAASS